MKKVLYFGLAVLVFVLLAMPAAAQRSNKGGKVQGNERAEEVQQMNKKADANRGFPIAPGVEKAETKKQQKDHDADGDKDKGNGKHKGKGRH